MKAETWREITLTDQLLECGPSNANSEFRIFSYLDFRNAGRLHNVAIMADLEGKLKKLLGVDSCTMHLILGKNAINGDAYNLLIALGISGKFIYAVDPQRIGIISEIEASRRDFRSATLRKYLGILIGLVGIPLILVIFGSVMVVAGFFTWRSAEQQRKALASKIELLKLHKKGIDSLSEARLL